LIVAAG